MLKYVFNLLLCVIPCVVLIPVNAPCSQGSPFYLNMQEIFPGQSRISYKHIQFQEKKCISKGWAKQNSNGNGWKLRFDNGKAVYSLNKAYPVILAPFGYLLVDGHHHLMASRTFGAQTAPVYLVADLSQLTEEEFWKKAEIKNFVFLIDVNGKRTLPPKDFQELQNDPNRYFISLVRLKFKNDGYERPQGTDYPLWIKREHIDAPFLECKAADALTQAQFIYDEDAFGKAPSDASIELARKILLKTNIAGFELVKEKIHFSDLLNTYWAD